MNINQKFQEELEKIQDHDCHLSQDSGCATCERIHWLKNWLSKIDERKADRERRQGLVKTKLVVEADCDGLNFNQVNL